MPTFDSYARFDRDFKKLSKEDRARFRRVVAEHFVPDVEKGVFRAGLRVKKVQSSQGVYEMTWAPDGRATWEYGPEQRAGTPHAIWRRVGTHEIFDPGPP